MVNDRMNAISTLRIQVEKSPAHSPFSKCKHNIRENEYNSILCDLLGWISPKVCWTCRIERGGRS